MKLAIAGSVRLAGNAEAEKSIRDFLTNFAEDPFVQLTEVVSGGAKGIDSMAVAIAKKLGIPTKEFPPDEPNWPAYKKRNLEIADNAVRVLRFLRICISYTNCFHRDWDVRKYITWKQAWKMSATRSTAPRRAVVHE